MHGAVMDVSSRGKESGKASTSMGFGVSTLAPSGRDCCREVVSDPLEDKSDSRRDTPSAQVASMGAAAGLV